MGEWVLERGGTGLSDAAESFGGNWPGVFVFVFVSIFVSILVFLSE